MNKEFFFSRCRPNKATDCWLWAGDHASNGYARYNGVRVHRIAWTLFSTVPIGYLSVLHRCDNPGCVNPDHLFLGTYSDNQVDRVRKGRHNTAILTVAAVEEVKMRREPSHIVAKDYGVSSSTIRKIRNGINWKHV